MKTVDFIIWGERETFFIELKDPEHSRAPDERRSDFVRKLSNGQLDSELAQKFRDSILYCWLSGRLPFQSKNIIHYAVILGLTGFDSSLFLRRMEGLSAKLPVNGPNNLPWANPWVTTCTVHSIEGWNRRFPQFRITRQPPSPKAP
ncbi:MAG: hypothetical protein SF002_08505 [Alphaproteobacteria bacterium]|nr:hypothetical protein [Alphaproteobacteria bacterium]